MDKEEANRMLRNSFNNILKYKPTSQELIRKKEIEKIARQEKEEYEKKRTDFYSNPLHWDNNKRRRCRFPVLRGNINRHRSKRYPSFHPTACLMCTIEDIINEVLADKFKNYEFFGQFVDIKDLVIGEAEIYEILH